MLIYDICIYLLTYHQHLLQHEIQLYADLPAPDDLKQLTKAIIAYTRYRHEHARADSYNIACLMPRAATAIIQPLQIKAPHCID
jgi:hypothetical protein